MLRRSLLFEDPSQKSQGDSSVRDISDGFNPVLPGYNFRPNTWKGIGFTGYAE